MLIGYTSSEFAIVDKIHRKTSRDPRDLELAFANREIRALCLSGHLAEEDLGRQLTSMLRRRLADLSAMVNVSELSATPWWGFEELDKCDGRGLIKLGDGYALLFESGHRKTPHLENGMIDWSKVRRIKILGVEKRNDGKR
ncbi:hypothetical protein [Marinobacter sp. LN3S78]|uniref:hypothetical protein n=1 Tax=Marinobacter sp. LN3S78 TaxID=3382300 RepID=UPI00387B5FE6